MSATPDDTPASDSWEQDAWAEDAWKRDDWKNADWGKPAAPSSGVPKGPRKRGLAAYNAGMIEAGPYLTFGLQIAFAMVFFVGLGYALDRFLGSTPWGMVGGAAVGMVAVFALIARMAREADARQRAKRDASQDGAE
ncbi:MAG: AtpZ/AtpI family protein [Rhodothermaceae bacterium]|nr:AtpZ/AtpI family protein [Rhodothermaceae bacterium]